MLGDLKEIDGNLIIENGDLRIRIVNGNRSDKPQLSTIITLDILLIVSNIISPLITLSIDEFIKIRNLTDAKAARKRLIFDLKILSNIGFRNNKTTGETKIGKIVESDRGYVSFEFSEGFFTMFAKGQFMYFPKKAFEVNIAKYRYTYMFVRRICEHIRINIIKNKTVLEEKEIAISIHTLLESCPIFPAYESLGEAKQVAKRLIKPFENNMNEIINFTWKYKTYYSGRNYFKSMLLVTFDNYPNIDTKQWKIKKITKKTKNK